MEAHRHAQLDTGLGADSVALVGPASATSSSAAQLAIVGTYSLQEGSNAASRKRAGALLLVAAERIGDSCALRRVSTREDLPGVLDVATSPSGNDLYAVCAEDTLLRLCLEEEPDAIVPHAEAVGTQGDRIVLSVDVVPDGIQGGVMIASSDSTGGVALHYTRGEDLCLKQRWEDVHTQEVWSVCVGSQDGGDVMLYSGGDDGALVGFGTRESGERFRLRKPHGGVGVTTVARDRFDVSSAAAMQLWTGGYDDVLKLWDLRNMLRCVEEVNVGGGVWRVRFHPSDRDVMLVAAMYDGFKVVRREASDRLHVVCEYRGHESLAYGASWVPALDWEGAHVALTGSFYDHSLQLWSVKNEP